MSMLHVLFQTEALKYYKSLQVVKLAVTIFKFTDILGPFEQTNVTVNYSEIQTLPEVYSHQHTTFQYISLFRSIGVISNVKTKDG